MDRLLTPSRHTFAFVTSNPSWGGSEELWTATAAELAAAGHEVRVYVVRHHRHEPRMGRLNELGCSITALEPLPLVPAKLMRWLMRAMSPAIIRLYPVRLRWALAARSRPDLAVVSQGGNFDGVALANVCGQLSIPYVMISQKAQDTRWPPDAMLEALRQAYGRARVAYFVSEHNRRLTEEQAGISLPRAAIVRNPFQTPWAPPNNWPPNHGSFRLACVGRLFPLDKGQDLLLRVLAREKWRARPISVTFYGGGPNRQGLEAMARFLRLDNVRFAGFVRDVASIWDEHHALILPSRAEGLPLVLIEAMLRERLPIVTDVAGAEVVDDDETGFLAKGATEDALDEAMERAWARRDAWPGMASLAGERVRRLTTESPPKAFAELLLTLVRDEAQPKAPCS